MTKISMPWRPKKPKAPRAPTKPKEPPVEVEERHPLDIDMESDSHNETVSFQSMIDQAPDEIPLSDVFIKIENDWEYTAVNFYYRTWIPNPYYREQYEKYEKKMKAYEAKLPAHEEAKKHHAEEMEDYKQRLARYEDVVKRINDILKSEDLGKSSKKSTKKKAKKRLKRR